MAFFWGCLMAGWFRCESAWWPAIADTLTSSGQAWPREAALADLRWWRDQELRRGERVMPGRVELAKRWRWTDHNVRRAMREDMAWADRGWIDREIRMRGEVAVAALAEHLRLSLPTVERHIETLLDERSIELSADGVVRLPGFVGSPRPALAKVLPLQRAPTTPLPPSYHGPTTDQPSNAGNTEEIYHGPTTDQPPPSTRAILTHKTQNTEHGGDTPPPTPPSTPKRPTPPSAPSGGGACSASVVHTNPPPPPPAQGEAPQPARNAAPTVGAEAATDARPPAAAFGTEQQNRPQPADSAQPASPACPPHLAEQLVSEWLTAAGIERAPLPPELGWAASLIRERGEDGAWEAVGAAWAALQASGLSRATMSFCGLKTALGRPSPQASRHLAETMTDDDLVAGWLPTWRADLAAGALPAGCPADEAGAVAWFLAGVARRAAEVEAALAAVEGREPAPVVAVVVESAPPLPAPAPPPPAPPVVAVAAPPAVEDAPMPPPRPPLVPSVSIPPSALIIQLPPQPDARAANIAWAKCVLDWGAVQIPPAGANGQLYRMIWGGLVESLKAMWRTGEGNREGLAEQVEKCRRLGPTERQIPGKFSSGGAR